MKWKEISRDFAKVINRHGLDNAANTPDYILGEYCSDLLAAYLDLLAKHGKHEAKEMNKP